MKKNSLKIAAAFALGFCAVEADAQLALGATAPDFTLKDYKGVSYTLYSYLNKGQAALVDISATWCGPCWSYHKSGALNQFYGTNGPEGTNKAMAFWIDGDDKTNDACLTKSTGCIGGSQGDWTAGTTFPMINVGPTEIKAFDAAWRINAFPTIYLICPDKKIVLRSQASASQLQTAMESKCQISTALHEGGIKSRVSVGPGISTGRVVVEVNAGARSPVNVEVYNAMGALVFARDSRGAKTIGFDLAAQPNGLYYFKVTVEDESITRKIVLGK